MSGGNILSRLNERFGVGLQRVRLYRINGEARDGCVPTQGVEIFLLTQDRIPPLQQVNPSLDLRKWGERLGKNNLCYCVVRSGILAHYTWVQTSGRHRILRAGRYKEISPGEFWIYECWTSDSERGRGIYPSVLSRVVRDHFERGLQEGVIYTTPQNVPSQRGILKAGFHHSQTLYSIRLGRYYIPI